MSEFRFKISADVLAAFAGLAKVKEDMNGAAFGLCVQPDGGVDLALDVGASSHWAARIDSGATVSPDDALGARNRWLWVAPRVADAIASLAKFAPGGKVDVVVDYTPELSIPGTVTLAVPGASQVLTLDSGETYKAPEAVADGGFVAPARDVAGVLARAAHCLDKHEDRGLHQARVDGGPGGATLYASDGHTLAVLPLRDPEAPTWTRLVPSCAIKPLAAALGGKKVGDNPVAVRPAGDDNLQVQTLDGMFFEVQPGDYDEKAGTTKALPKFVEQFCGHETYHVDLDVKRVAGMPAHPDAWKGGGYLGLVVAQDGRVLACAAADMHTRVTAETAVQVGTWTRPPDAEPLVHPAAGFRCWVFDRGVLAQVFAALGKPKTARWLLGHNCEASPVAVPGVGMVVVMPCRHEKGLGDSLEAVFNGVWEGVEDGNVE